MKELDEVLPRLAQHYHFCIWWWSLTTLTTALICALKPGGAFSKPRIAKPEYSQCWKKKVCSYSKNNVNLQELKQRPPIKLEISSGQKIFLFQQDWQHLHQVYQSRWCQTFCFGHRNYLHMKYLCKLVQYVWLNILCDEESKNNLEK